MSECERGREGERERGREGERERGGEGERERGGRGRGVLMLINNDKEQISLKFQKKT